MAPEKPKNDPHMLKIPKIFDLYHQTLRLKFLYRGSTIYLIRTFLNDLDMTALFSDKADNTEYNNSINNKSDFKKDAR